MKYNARQYAEALLESCDGLAKAKIDQIIDTWLKLIKEQGQLSLLPVIESELSALSKSHQMLVEVEAAKTLTKDIKTLVIEYLADKSLGREIVLSEKINQKLLAGIVISYDDQKIDLSLQQVLNTLKEKIVN